MTPVELLLALNRIPEELPAMEDVIRALTLIRSTESLDEVSALFAHRFFDPFVIDSRVTSNIGKEGRYYGLMQQCWLSLVGSAGLQRPWRMATPYGVGQADSEMEIRMAQWLHHGLRADIGGRDSDRQLPIVFQTLLDWAEHYPWAYDPILASAIQHRVWPTDMLERLCALPRSIGPLALSAMAEYALRGAPYPLPAAYRCAPSLGRALVLTNEQSALVRELYSGEWSQNLARYVSLVAEHLRAMLDEPGAHTQRIDLPGLES